jgi:hypothetical protein
MEDGELGATHQGTLAASPYLASLGEEGQSQPQLHRSQRRSDKSRQVSNVSHWHRST